MPTLSSVLSCPTFTVKPYFQGGGGEQQGSAGGWGRHPARGTSTRATLQEKILQPGGTAPPPSPYTFIMRLSNLKVLWILNSLAWSDPDPYSEQRLGVEQTFLIKKYMQAYFQFTSSFVIVDRTPGKFRRIREQAGQPTATGK